MAMSSRDAVDHRTARRRRTWFVAALLQQVDSHVHRKLRFEDVALRLGISHATLFVAVVEKEQCLFHSWNS